jgi:hypothetical protein
MFDAVIDGRSYDLREARTKTLAAQALMTEFKVKELPVWYTKASLDEIEAQGDPDGCDTGFRLFAVGCDPALNEA